MGPVTSVGFRAMGTTCEIHVIGADLVPIARERITELESAWSRFLPDSDVSRLNRAIGEPVDVAPDTIRLVSVATAAWRHTSGGYDPTVADAVAAAGYDRSFDELGPVTTHRPAHPTFGCAGIEIDAANHTVRLPLGVRIDAGGIGKGLAADLALEALTEAGTSDALVNIGGDIAAMGDGPYGNGWPVAISADATDAEGITVHIRNGGVATSTTLKRRWNTTHGPAHHLIDPTTGANPVDGPVMATAIAGTAWWAEAATKPLMIHGSAAAPPEVSWRTVAGDGAVTTGAGFEAFVARAA